MSFWIWLHQPITIGGAWLLIMSFRLVDILIDRRWRKQ